VVPYAYLIVHNISYHNRTAILVDTKLGDYFTHSLTAQSLAQVNLVFK